MRRRPCWLNAAAAAVAWSGVSDTSNDSHPPWRWVTSTRPAASSSASRRRAVQDETPNSAPRRPTVMSTALDRLPHAALSVMAAYRRHASAETIPAGRRRPAQSTPNVHAGTAAKRSPVSAGRRLTTCRTLRLLPRGADRARKAPSGTGASSWRRASSSVVVDTPARSAKNARRAVAGARPPLTWRGMSVSYIAHAHTASPLWAFEYSSERGNCTTPPGGRPMVRTAAVNQTTPTTRRPAGGLYGFRCNS